jgi:hypothetical protein
MSELRHGYDTARKSEKEIANKIVKIVEWLAYVETGTDYYGQAARLGYYDVMQEGPIMHGQVYFGVHKYEDNDEPIRQDYRMLILAPDISIDKRGFKDDPLLDITVNTDRTVTVNGHDYSRSPAYVETISDDYIDWLSSASLTHSMNREQL